MALDELRECPIDGCTNQHTRALLMCRKHWFMAPADLRADLWRAYKGDGVLSEEYEEARAAVMAAVEELEAQPQARRRR